MKKYDVNNIILYNLTSVVCCIVLLINIGENMKQN